jgi:arabinan endo-1,5-alpha-L-arabinosidase
MIAASGAFAGGGSEPRVSDYSSGVSVHDPSVVKSPEGVYYIFGSHMEVAKSDDLRSWRSVASGVSTANPLFENLLSNPTAFDFVGRNDEGGYSVWAPDVIYNHAMQRYVMYFSKTSSYVKSSIGFATAESIEGPYSYQGTVVYSGFTQADIEKTDVLEYVTREDTFGYAGSSSYRNYQWPNAIDPAVFYDADGRMWMVYGSWSGGIFILEIDESTGRPIRRDGDRSGRVDAYFGIHLTGGNHRSIEGPYIVYDESSQYYYLFVSYGRLVSDGGYQIRVFRSRRPDGPYLDPAGRNVDPVYPHDEYGLKLLGNYTPPSLPRAYKSPGHNSALIDEDGTRLLVYHVRFDDGTEYHEPRVHQWFLNADGWPVVAPFAYSGERLSDRGEPISEILGTYLLVEFGVDLSDRVAEPREITLRRGGTVVDAERRSIGSWETTDDSPFMSLIIDGTSYEGVFLRQPDEAGNDAMTFTAASNENDSVWGVMY